MPTPVRTLSHARVPVGSQVNRRGILIASAWSVPVLVLAAATPTAAASGIAVDLAVTFGAPLLDQISSGGGSTPFTLGLTELAGGTTSGPVVVQVSRVDPLTGYPTVVDSITPPSFGGWVYTVTPDFHVFTYSPIIAGLGSSTTFSGTWSFALSPAGLVGGDVTATLVPGSGGDGNATNDSVTLPFATTLDLGAAALLTVLAGDAATANAATVVNGLVGANVGAAIVDFPPATQFATADEAAAAKTAMVIAYAAAMALTPADELPAQLGATTILPGVHHSTAALGLTGVLTLDALGDPNAVFIIQVPDAAITTAAGSSVVLANGADASRIFWVTGFAITLGASSTFLGNMLVLAAVTFGAGAIVTGHVLAPFAGVTFDANTISPPA